MSSETYASQIPSALTTCPDCGKEMSRKAAACPNCGRVGTQTVEQTGKRWKAARVVGSLCAIAGLTSILVNAIGTLHTPSMLYCGLLLMVIGIACNFAARFGAWWFHG